MTDITVITAARNNAATLADCLRAVGEQSQHTEHLVVDGESTDESALLARTAGVRLLSQPPLGIYAALNSGIAQASGEILGILHADDFYPTRDVLERVREVFRDPRVDACYGDLCYVHPRNPNRIVRYWKAGEFRRKRFLSGWMPPHPTFFVRRRVYAELGSFREDLGTAADYELMLRFLYRHSIHAAYIPEVLVHMRVGGASNRSVRARLQANRMDRRAWIVNDLRPRPWTLLMKPMRKLGQWWRRP